MATRQWTLDEVIARLNEAGQRATYGAVGGVVGRPARGLMRDRQLTGPNSWVVAKTTKKKTDSRRGWPTGYADGQIDGRCLKQIRAALGEFIDTPAKLRVFLGK